MTGERTNEPMTEAEVRAFAAKTQAWWEQLTAKEQALFHRAIKSAASAEGDDVQGHVHLEYGQTAFSMLWPFVENAINSVNWSALNPHTATPVPTGGTSGGSSGGTAGGARLLN